jgi:flavodoxin
MRALVVYESMFGNTAEVARAVATGLSAHLEVELRNVADAAPGATSGQRRDLLVVGGPTHAFSMSRPQTREDAVRKGADPAVVATGIRDWLAESQTSTAFATFDTKVARVRRLPGSAAHQASRAARRRGHSRAARPESFYVEDTKGPLLDGELDRARAWGERLGAEAQDRAAARRRPV